MRLKFSISLIYSLIIFQFLDGICTYIGVNRYGIWIEGNPLIVKSIVALGNFWGLVIPKAFAVILLYCMYKMIRNANHVSLFGVSVLLLVNLIYAWVVYCWLGALIFGI